MGRAFEAKLRFARLQGQVLPRWKVKSRHYGAVATNLTKGSRHLGVG